MCHGPFRHYAWAALDEDGLVCGQDWETCPWPILMQCRNPTVSMEWIMVNSTPKCVTLVIGVQTWYDWKVFELLLFTHVSQGLPRIPEEMTYNHHPLNPCKFVAAWAVIYSYLHGWICLVLSARRLLVSVYSLWSLSRLHYQFLQLSKLRWTLAGQSSR